MAECFLPEKYSAIICYSANLSGTSAVFHLSFALIIKSTSKQKQIWAELELDTECDVLECNLSIAS